MNRKTLALVLLVATVAVATFAAVIAQRTLPGHGALFAAPEKALEGEGAPALLRRGQLDAFAAAFDGDGKTPPLLALVSPTTGKDGVEALRAFLAEYDPYPIHVVVVWEPAQAADESGPKPEQWHALGDKRVTQFWDPLGQVSDALLAASGAPRQARVFDFGAGYRPGTRWVPPPDSVVFHGPLPQMIHQMLTTLKDTREVFGSSMPPPGITSTPQSAGTKAAPPSGSAHRIPSTGFAPARAPDGGASPRPPTSSPNGPARR